MKTLKINKIILLLIGFVVFNGCVQDDDFSTPNLSFEEPNLENVRTLGSLAGDLAQEQNGFGSEEVDYSNESDIVPYIFNDDDEYVSGYVVSSDEGGNYFEEIILQDKPENPTIGIKLLIDVNPLFTKYEVGRKIYVKINGLAVGISNGVLVLGSPAGSGVDKIPSQFENEFIERSTEVATIVPLPLNISDFTEDKTNLMITLSDVQFNRNEVFDTENNLNTYASSELDQFDGERTLESCATGGDVIFSTSTFADFKGLALPSGQGNVNAVLSRTFEGDDFIVAINTPEDITFNNPERCDPVDISDFTIVFEEDFTDGLTGWEVFNTVGTRSWFAASFDGEFYARGSAFVSGSTVQMVSWLISPSFDFDAQAGEQMVLQIADAFSDAGEEPLTALYSNDYVLGTDPSTATWTEVGSDQIEALPINTGFFDNEYDSTDLIDLSAVTGTGFIAFVFDSNNATISSTRDLGNVKIVTP
ncbi:DUF5689 domain-containing protein [Winogradskyella forsetii]|uniref:DUF5689 domain-containing protein n=1 Tax=Winogradskyella forsetii TaxID=2686077 RepID=UPI0015B8CBCD|nr:DUF5689 domain-containing protein [Winogradskyella forsetii]